MSQRLFGLLLSALLFVPAPSAAQDQAPPDDASEIVVTGTRDMERQVRDFVGALTQAPSGGQLSRFEAAICPTVVGVSPAQKQAIVTRMKRVAGAAGIAVGGASCTPNVLVVVTGEKKAFVEGLWKRHSYYFGQMSAGDVRKLASEPGPAAAWHVDGPPRTADGVELQQAGGGPYVNRTTRNPSRIGAAARPQFAAAAVVVEMKALDGLTTTQLADYAAMRTFARTDPRRLPETAPSILRALEAPMGSEVPITMTPWDLAFLKSFYAAPRNLSAASQRSQIGGRLQGELERAEDKN
jgi:hypothetical protein